MALTAIQIASQALVRLGALPISDFAEPTLEARTAAALYPDAPRHAAGGPCLALRHRRGGACAGGSAAARRLRARLPAAGRFPERAGRGWRAARAGWRIAAGMLHAHPARLRLAYIFRAGEAEFPPWFADALAAHLAAAFCLPVTENTSRAEALQRLAESQRSGAPGARTRSTTRRRAPLRFPLIEARA